MLFQPFYVWNLKPWEKVSEDLGYPMIHHDTSPGSAWDSGPFK